MIDTAAEKLAEDVAVCPMNFHAVVARSLTALSGGDEVVSESSDFAETEGSRSCIGVCGRANWGLTNQLLRGSHPGMMQLDNGQALMTLDLGSQALVAIEEVVREDAELAGKALANLLDMGGAGHGQAEPTLCSLGEPVEFILAQLAVLVALTVGHGRQHEAILHCDATWEGDWRCWVWWIEHSFGS